MQATEETITSGILAVLCSHRNHTLDRLSISPDMRQTKKGNYFTKDNMFMKYYQIATGPFFRENCNFLLLSIFLELGQYLCKHKEEFSRNHRATYLDKSLFHSIHARTNDFDGRSKVEQHLQRFFHWACPIILTFRWTIVCPPTTNKIIRSPD